MNANNRGGAVRIDFGEDHVDEGGQLQDTLGLDWFTPHIL